MNFFESFFWAFGTLFILVAFFISFLITVAIIDKIRRPLVRILLVILYFPVLLVTSSLSRIAKLI